MQILNGDNWTVTGFWKNQAIPTLGSPNGNHVPAPVREIKATVPGGIQKDLLGAGVIRDWNYGTRSVDCEWTEHREWVYRREFKAEKAKEGQYKYLCFDGLDFSGEIYLNGKKLAEFNGMHIPYEFDVTNALEENNVLKVYFKQPPDVDGQYGFTSKISTFKSRFNYFWDWCPRIVPVGIWGDVYIKTCKSVRINHAKPCACVSGSVETPVCITAAKAGGYQIRQRVLYKDLLVCEDTTDISAPVGNSTQTVKIQVKNPEIWNVAGFGENPLYSYEIELIEKGEISDKIKRSIGFRSIEFTKPENPKPDSLPYLAVINGRPLFLRGVNWVPVSPVYGSVTREDYERQIGILADMDINLIRVWGGAVLESEDFYDTCDRMGILVWQEFPQSSSGIDNYPPEDDLYIAELSRIAESFILRRGHHPSHAIWCAGNELYDQGTELASSPRHPNFTALKRIVADLDPAKLYLPGSPSGGEHTFGTDKDGNRKNYDLHGPWDHEGDPEHYIRFNADDSHLNSEIGGPSAARLSNLIKYSDGYDLWPPDNSNRYWQHRASWWIRYDKIKEMFGEYKGDGSDMYRYVQYTRFLHCESVRYPGESTRRRFPGAAGFIVWMGNESFPNAANTSLLEYDGAAKQAYFAVKEVFEQVNISAKYGKIKHDANETIDTELFVTSDIPANVDFTASFLDVYGNVLKSGSFSAETNNSTAFCGEFSLENGVNGAIILRITWDGKHKHYYFTRGGETSYGAFAQLAETEITAEKTEAGWLVENKGVVAAVGVYLLVEGEQPVNIYPNNLTLLPGERAQVYPFGSGNGKELVIEGLNVNIK